MNKKTLYISIACAFLLIVGVIACSNSEQHILPPGPKPEIEEPEVPEDPNAPKKIVFEESTEIIANPERGFYTYRQFVSGETTTLTPEFVQEYREQGITLIFTTYTLKDFRDKPITADYLERIKTNMQALRDGGGKAVLRFCYTDSEADKPWDAPWAITENHIKQLTPIFQEYVDVIALLEAGFIGVWGEWYYTDNYIMSPADDEYGPRKQVLDALLKAIPKERMISIRYPKAKIMSFGITHENAITEAEAYKYSDLARVSGHNDCFLADQDDRGTFGGNRNYRKYWENETKYYVMGGETCALSSYAECENALSDMRKYHWSYININYRQEVIQGWKDNGCFDEIQRNLGYRFVLQDGTFDRKGTVGKAYNMKINLTNIGWAAPYNPRNAEIILVSSTNAEDKHVIKLDEDPRYWFTDEKINLDLKINIPAAAAAGKYTLYLNLPDPATTLAGKPEFSIQLANKGVWQASTGYNKLYEIDVVSAQ